MLPTLQIGPAALQLPALLIVLGFWVGITRVEKTSELYGIPGNLIFRLLFASSLAGILGARLAYILRYIEVFIESPISMFSLNYQLLDGEAGLLIGALVLIILGQKNGLPFWRILDALTIGFAVLMIFLAAANFASGNAYGSLTRLPWGIPLWGESRHPVQVYDFLLAIGILLIVRPGGKLAAWLREHESREGAVFLVFAALTSAARLFTEAFRGDSVFLWGGLRSGQVIAFFALAVCLFLLRRRLRVPK